MSTLLQLLISLAVTIQANRLLDYTPSSSPSPVCLKIWSHRVGIWLFLGETESLSETCMTKWYISPEFSLCDIPGQCFTITSADSGLYLSKNIGQLSPLLSESTIWNLSPTPAHSNERSFLLKNVFLDSIPSEKHSILCSTFESAQLHYKNDETDRFCHWYIHQIVTSEPTKKPTPNNECPNEHRHRKPWYSLNKKERELFVSAVKELNNNGQLHALVAVHANFSANVQAHGCASFIPFHRYHLWEFENAVRNLGGKYKCFSLPYWDITREALESLNPLDWYILNSGLGGNGVESDDWCVNDEIFGKDSEYEPYLHCVVDAELSPIDENDHDRAQCCLKRNVCEKECVIFKPTDIIHSIVALPEYGSDEHQMISDPTLPPSQPNIRKIAPLNSGFQYDLENKHGSFHGVIGGLGHLNNLHFSPDEPIFWLMHNFVDYIWALWQDCHDYDLVKECDIDSRIYNGVLGEPDNIVQLMGPSRIDDAFLLKELKQTDWAYVGNNDITVTPRDMHNISRWKYSFEKGPFWKNARVEKFCPNINQNWFYSDRK